MVSPALSIRILNLIFVDRLGSGENKLLEHGGSVERV